MNGPEPEGARILRAAIGGAGLCAVAWGLTLAALVRLL
jgi:hypothetical protein